MSGDKHPFDRAAEQLEAQADAPVRNQNASPDFWVLRHAADESTGDFPQVVPVVEPEFDPEGEIDDTDGLDPDGFPRDPLADRKLQGTANWTDVLSGIPDDGYLMNARALATFRGCNLGLCREFPATVIDHDGSPRALTCLFVKNTIPPTSLDFPRSAFYVVDILGLKVGEIEIDSFEHWKEQFQLATEGKLDGADEFSSIRIKQLFFKPGQAPTVDMFQLERIDSSTFITSRMKDAIEASGISGLDIRPNKRLFVAPA